MSNDTRSDVRAFFQRYHVNVEREGVTPTQPQSSIIASVDRSGQQAYTTTSNNLSPQPLNTSTRSLLPPPMPHHQGQNLLVLDIDETLVHSSFSHVQGVDLVLPVIVEGQTYQVYIKFRPFLREFLQQVSTMFECAVFTASLGPYADGLMDYLDPGRRMC
eukprot:PhF_6_TR26105/c2_g2_i2/m.36909/K15731/CTDSP; carboxy-terminal domain RNA polymerase II polypeptide A small phosphatase